MGNYIGDFGCRDMDMDKDNVTSFGLGSERLLINNVPLSRRQNISVISLLHERTALLSYSYLDASWYRLDKQSNMAN